MRKEPRVSALEMKVVIDRVYSRKAGVQRVASMPVGVLVLKDLVMGRNLLSASSPGAP